MGACLNRTNSGPELAALEQAWGSLCISERSLLMAHLLADGISRKAFMFTFLPLYLSNARANEAVGLGRALAMLAEVVEMLHLRKTMEHTDAMVITINLSDLAAFA